MEFTITVIFHLSGRIATNIAELLSDEELHERQQKIPAFQTKTIFNFAKFSSQNLGAWLRKNMCNQCIVFKSWQFIINYLLSVRKLLEYSDYLESVSKEDPLYEYNNSKETMRKILTDFHKNCRLRLENLKAKHRRELRLLARLKQEQAEKGDVEAVNGNVQKNFFGFPIRGSIVRYVNGVVP